MRQKRSVPEEHIVIDSEIAVTMRDGIVLRADIYSPDDFDKYPAKITRTPHDRLKAFSIHGSRYMDFPGMARAGYCVVVQDCRGTGSSPREFHPRSSDDQSDGHDTVLPVIPMQECKIEKTGKLKS